MSGKNKMKTYAISGWVQVGVYAEIKAKSLAEAKRMYKKDGIAAFNYFHEGDWESDITLDSPIEEDKHPTYRRPQNASLS